MDNGLNLNEHFKNVADQNMDLERIVSECLSGRSCCDPQLRYRCTDLLDQQQVSCCRRNGSLPACFQFSNANPASFSNADSSRLISSVNTVQPRSCSSELILNGNNSEYVVGKLDEDKLLSRSEEYSGVNVPGPASIIDDHFPLRMFTDGGGNHVVRQGEIQSSFHDDSRHHPTTQLVHNGFSGPAQIDANRKRRYAYFEQRHETEEAGRMVTMTVEGKVNPLALDRGLRFVTSGEHQQKQQQKRQHQQDVIISEGFKKISGYIQSSMLTSSSDDSPTMPHRGSCLELDAVECHDVSSDNNYISPHGGQTLDQSVQAGFQSGGGYMVSDQPMEGHCLHQVTSGAQIKGPDGFHQAQCVDCNSVSTTCTSKSIDHGSTLSRSSLTSIWSPSSISVTGKMPSTCGMVSSNMPEMHWNHCFNASLDDGSAYCSTVDRNAEEGMLRPDCQDCVSKCQVTTLTTRADTCTLNMSGGACKDTTNATTLNELLSVTSTVLSPSFHDIDGAVDKVNGVQNDFTSNSNILQQGQNEMEESQITEDDSADKKKLPDETCHYGCFISNLLSCRHRSADGVMMAYLNKGQHYTLNVTGPQDFSTAIRVRLSIVVYRNKTLADQFLSWQHWYMNLPVEMRQRALKFDGNSVRNIQGHVEELAYNALIFSWRPAKGNCTIDFAVNCLSADFHLCKGVKCQQLCLLVEMWTTDPRAISENALAYRAYCPIKVFCEKGAERKVRQERKTQLQAKPRCRYKGSDIWFKDETGSTASPGPAMFIPLEIVQSIGMNAHMSDGTLSLSALPTSLDILRSLKMTHKRCRDNPSNNNNTRKTTYLLRCDQCLRPEMIDVGEICGRNLIEELERRCKLPSGNQLLLFKKSKDGQMTPMTGMEDELKFGSHDGMNEIRIQKINDTTHIATIME